MVSRSSKAFDPYMGRPHVLILGAGASLAAFPNGDKWGRKLPLMNNLVDVVGLHPILKRAGIGYQGENFESLYSDLAISGKYSDCVQEIEQAVFDYFAQLQLPESPTLYDHLVLSLRKKDVIATFNWDPLLMRAWARNQSRASSMPAILFLHGNTDIGYCMAHKPVTVGSRGMRCTRCWKPYQDSRLLYPVAQKHYSADPFISKSWELLRACLKDAYVLTIFGYGAPSSDSEAVALMKDAWGTPGQRNLEEIEIIDIKSEDELVATWKDFINSHHYRTANSFYDSWTANQPRRTCEAMWQELMEIECLDNNPIPRSSDWASLYAWYEPLWEGERQADAKGSCTRPSQNPI